MSEKKITEKVLEKIEKRILSSLRFPAHWAEEGIAEPNMACKLKANEICKHIFEIYEKMPDRIAPTKEEGVSIAYDSPRGNKTLFIEVYNDLEAGFLLNDNERKQIITSFTTAYLSFSQTVMQESKEDTIEVESK